MSDAERIAAQYKRSFDRVGEDIAIRRYSGTGQSRTFADTTTRARVTGYEPKELVGTVQQGDRKLIALPTPLASILPLTTADKVVVRGKELAVVAVDDSTRRVGGTLIALEIQVRG